jgi:hypothetical protein
MSLASTELIIQGSPLPATFQGGPNDLFAAMLARMRIMSPGGANFIFVGDTAPTSNVGPWLRGKEWWVWDDNTKQYVPLDVSASINIPFAIGNSVPATTVPPVWLRTTQDGTDQAPNSFGDPIGWHVFNGADWIPFMSVTQSGATSQRPTAPESFQIFYDTTISCLIWFERGIWRTVSGVPGDVKFVNFTTLTQALQYNPGWDYIGSQVPAYRGRLLVGATQDSGANPQSNFPPLPGVPPRAAFDVFGESVQLTTGSGTVYPPQLALWTLVKL